MKAYKGFNKDMTCRDYQYKEGETYEHNGNVRLCDSGFHACENPLDCFGYYAPGQSVYREVEMDGVSDEREGDSKVVGKKITIGAEVGLSAIAGAAVKFIFEKIDWGKAAATNTGYYSAATNTGYYSAATNTGYRSAAEVSGKESVAMAIGFESKAAGAKGCFIVLGEWKENSRGELHLKDVKSAKVDGEIIKANTFYTLTNGEFVETE